MGSPVVVEECIEGIGLVDYQDTSVLVVQRLVETPGEDVASYDEEKGDRQEQHDRKGHARCLCLQPSAVPEGLMCQCPYSFKIHGDSLYIW